MGKFNKGGYAGDRGGGSGGHKGGRDFARPSFGGGRGGDRRGGGGERGGFGGGAVSMHKAVCSDCGNGCEVPFKPTGEKPVFCSDCFGAKRENAGGGFRDNKRESYGNKGGDRRDGGAPAKSADNSKDIADLKRRVEELHNKLDTMLSIVDSRKATEKKIESVKSVAPVVKAEVKAPAKKVEVKKAPAKKAAKKAAKKK